MAIKINDISPEGLTLELTQRIDLFDNDAGSAEFNAVLRIQPESGGIFHISGKVRATAQLECSRCLIRFPYTIDSDFSIDLAPVSSLGTSAGQEHELGSGELDMEFYHGDEIEPIDIIREQLLISVPMVPLHDPGCKGLCSVCGADLNKVQCGHQQKGPEDIGPFAALKDLLKK
jgi:uncharacterized protein